MNANNLTYENLNTILKFIDTVLYYKLNDKKIPAKCPGTSHVYLTSNIIEPDITQFILMNISAVDNYHDAIFSYGKFTQYHQYPTSFSMCRVVSVSLESNNNLVLNMNSFERMELMKCTLENVDAVFMQYCLLYEIPVAFEMCIASYLHTCYSTRIKGTFRVNTDTMIHDKYLYYMEMYNTEHGGKI